MQNRVRDMGRVEGSEEQARPLIVGKDTVYVHTNIVQIEEGLYEYDEIQYDLDKYIEIMAEKINALAQE